MYDVLDYLAMVGDRRRSGPIEAALARVIRPGDRVIDLGCGFGYFSVLAARAGAAHVDAIDINPAASLVHRLAAENGVADRITVHQQDARAVTLAAPADLLLSDLRGALPVMGDHLEVLADVRRRLLRPDARHVWQRDHLFVALATAADWHHEAARAPALSCGVETIRALALTAPFAERVQPDAMISEGGVWATLNYATVEPGVFRGRATLRAQRSAPLEALVLWFDAELQPGIGFSTAPGSPLRPYRQIVLPIHPAVSLRIGDEVEVALSATQTPQGYLWTWQGEIGGRGTVFSANSLPAMAAAAGALGA